MHATFKEFLFDQSFQTDRWNKAFCFRERLNGIACGVVRNWYAAIQYRYRRRIEKCYPKCLFSGIKTWGERIYQAEHYRAAAVSDNSKQSGIKAGRGRQRKAVQFFREGRYQEFCLNSGFLDQRFFERILHHSVVAFYRRATTILQFACDAFFCRGKNSRQCVKIHRHSVHWVQNFSWTAQYRFRYG